MSDTVRIVVPVGVLASFGLVGLTSVALVVHGLAIAAYAFDLRGLALPSLFVVAVIVCWRDFNVESVRHRDIGIVVAACLVVLSSMFFQLATLTVLLTPCWLLCVCVSLLGWRRSYVLTPMLLALASLALLQAQVVNVCDKRLQLATTQVSVFIFRLLGFEVYAHDTTIVGLGVPLYVTQACAGTTVMAGAFIATAVLLTAFLQRWRVRVLLGVTVLFAISNVLRIVLIGIIAHFGGRDVGAAYHNLVGYLMTAAVFVILGFGVRELNRHVHQPSSHRSLRSDS